MCVFRMWGALQFNPLQPKTNQMKPNQSCGSSRTINPHLLTDFWWMVSFRSCSSIPSTFAIMDYFIPVLMSYHSHLLHAITTTLHLLWSRKQCFLKCFLSAAIRLETTHITSPPDKVRLLLFIWWASVSVSMIFLHIVQKYCICLYSVPQNLYITAQFCTFA